MYIGRTSAPTLPSIPFDPADLRTWSFATSVTGPAARWNTTYRREGFHGLVIVAVLGSAEGNAVLPPTVLAGLPPRDVAKGGAAHTLSLLVEQAIIAAFDVAPPSEHPKVRKAVRNAPERGNLSSGSGGDSTVRCVYFAYRIVTSAERHVDDNVVALDTAVSTNTQGGNLQAVRFDGESRVFHKTSALRIECADDLLRGVRRGITLVQCPVAPPHETLEAEWESLGASALRENPTAPRDAVRCAVLSIATRLKAHMIATAERALCLSGSMPGAYVEVCIGRTHLTPLGSAAGSAYDPLDTAMWSFGSHGGPSSRWKRVYGPRGFHGLVVSLVIKPTDAAALRVLDSLGMATLRPREVAEGGPAHTLSLLVEQAVIGTFASTPLGVHPHVRKASFNTLDCGNTRGGKGVAHAVYFAYRIIQPKGT